MTTKQKVAKYESFLLRLWQKDGATTWHGEIESIQTGQKWQFDSLEIIITILQAQILADPIKDPEME